MKKVLFITYYWPPAGGPGVQRPLKFARYLPQFGWQPVVLTVKNGVYPATDASLLKEVPEGIEVYKSSCPEPDAIYRALSGKKNATGVGVLAQKELSAAQRWAHHIRLNHFIPDAKKFWKPFAIARADQIIEEHAPRLIWSTSPPPTTHLIAYKLAKRHGLKWLADFRDPWSRIHYYENKRSVKSTLKDRALEAQVLRECDAAICVSRKFASLLEIPPGKEAHILPNGYDAEDFKTDVQPEPGHFNIAYVGGLNSNRFYGAFFEELARWIKSDPTVAQKVKLNLAGQVDEHILKQIESMFGEWPGLLFHGYLAHGDAIQAMQKAHLLLLFMEKTSHYEGHLPGKLFEYLAGRRPILAFSPQPGEAAHILKETGAGVHFSQAAEALQWLKKRYAEWLASKKEIIDGPAIERYERKNLAGELAALFDEVDNEP